MSDTKISPFVHRTCARAVCTDCRQIAEEYAELYERQKAALMTAERVAQEAKREAAREKRRADDYDRVLKLGQHPMLLAWMESLSPFDLRVAVERAAEKGKQ